MSKPFYISTAIAYANAGPHIGHAFEFVTADTIARHHKSLGEKVFFVTGMDEHGQKIEQKAKEQNIETQTFVDRNAALFRDLQSTLGVEYDFFVRTSDKEKHYKGAQMLWNKLVEKGDIEKRAYQALYCVGCEEFKKDGDLTEDGLCPIHLKKVETVEEENYFFKLSHYTETIKSKITSGELEIIPGTRKNEILALLDRGLEDVSFSRPKSKVSWGIPVPGDEEQVMYVWCDALSNYITALGYGTDAFDKDMWENGTHVIGKDILRFHAAIWPGMLLSAGLSLPKRILVHGFITSGGQKMSKSLGNTISPEDILNLFSPACGELAGEAARFVLLHEVPTFEDGDITIDSIKASYTAHLANGIGNLTNRVLKMAITNNVSIADWQVSAGDKDMYISLESFDIKKAAEYIMQAVRVLDQRIQKEEPFKVVKIDKEKGAEIILYTLVELHSIANQLSIFMPKTSAKILECIRENKMPEKPLFNRLA